MNMCWFFPPAVLGQDSRQLGWSTIQASWLWFPGLHIGWGEWQLLVKFHHYSVILHSMQYSTVYDSPPAWIHSTLVAMGSNKSAWWCQFLKWYYTGALGSTCALKKTCNKTVIPSLSLSLSPFFLPSSPFTEHYSHLPSPPPPPPFIHSLFVLPSLSLHHTRQEQLEVQVIWSTSKELTLLPLSLWQGKRESGAVYIKEMSEGVREGG